MPGVTARCLGRRRTEAHTPNPPGDRQASAAASASARGRRRRWSKPEPDRSAHHMRVWGRGGTQVAKSPVLNEPERRAACHSAARQATCRERPASPGQVPALLDIKRSPSPLFSRRNFRWWLASCSRHKVSLPVPEGPAGGFRGSTAEAAVPQTRQSGEARKQQAKRSRAKVRNLTKTRKTDKIRGRLHMRPIKSSPCRRWSVVGTASQRHQCWPGILPSAATRS